MTLPPGQRVIDHFPRFGVPAFASRLPAAPGADFAMQARAAEAELDPIAIADRLNGAPLSLERSSAARVPRQFCARTKDLALLE
jgi:hypothetical protein